MVILNIARPHIDLQLVYVVELYSLVGMCLFMTNVGRTTLREFACILAKIKA